VENIYKKVEEELNISEHIIETVLKHKYSWLRKQLIEMKNIRVLDNNFGTFYVPEGKIKKYLTYLDSVESKTSNEEKLQADKDKYNEILRVVSNYNTEKKIKK
tara:strand:+ start:1294 stop:1602 length:309 start_codon:yes stop_codon:yes gene_type:complete